MHTALSSKSNFKVNKVESSIENFRNSRIPEKKENIIYRCLADLELLRIICLAKNYFKSFSRKLMILSC